MLDDIHSVRARQRVRPAAHRATIVVAAVALAAAWASTGCRPDTPAADTSCAATVASADAAVEPADSVRALDLALARCATYDEFIAAVGEHPGLIGYSPERFANVRCATLATTPLSTVPACLTAHPPTTLATVDADAPVYLGVTLDGRTIEIRPTAELPFQGDGPVELQRTAEAAIAHGCDGLRDRRDMWAALVADTDAGAIASVFTQHALNVAALIGCDLGPTP